MNWQHEQIVKRGGLKPIKADDIEVAFDEETETGHVPKAHLEAGLKAAVAAAEPIPAPKLVTVVGHVGAGDGPQPAHLNVTVSRILDE
jgi:hypothetical protein